MNFKKTTHTFTQFSSLKNTKGTQENLTPKKILNFILNNDYSSVKFNRNKRNKSNFKYTTVIILDIDSPQPKNKTIKEVSEQLSSINHIIAPTKSHQVIKSDGIQCDRYRILLFTNKQILNESDYRSTLSNFCEKYELNADIRAMDIGHYFYKSTSIYSSNFDGDLLNIVPIDDSKRIESKFEYRLSESPINEQLLEWIQSHPQKKIWTKREKFIRILTAQRRLPIRNELPQDFISSQLSIKRDTLKVWIDSLIKLGYLEYLSDLSYGKGFKAKSYKAKSALKDNILNEFGYKTVRELKSATPRIVLPKMIKDGHWNETLFMCAFNFAEDSNSDRFIQWVKTIPNWDKKPERLIQAKNCWKNRHLYLKRNS